jgi:hypothetical protein
MAASPAPTPSTIEATTIRKLRMHIIPFVFILFVIAYIDRINTVAQNRSASLDCPDIG